MAAQDEMAAAAQGLARKPMSQPPGPPGPRPEPSWARSVWRLLRYPAVRANARWEWARRLGGPPTLPGRQVRHVLVLCMGNLCRSPYAAALLAERMPELEVRSAGLNAADGHPAEPRAVEVARRRGVAL